MLTSVDCFENADFCAFWDAIENIHFLCWDDGPMLDILVDLFNNGHTVESAAKQAKEDHDIGQAEAWMAIPSWA